MKKSKKTNKNRGKKIHIAQNKGMSRTIECFGCDWSSREENGVFPEKSSMISMYVEYFFKAQSHER